MISKTIQRKILKRGEVEIISFSSPKEWERWLSKNFTREAGIWLRFYKKDSGKKTVIYAEALDVALCYGWIDGLLNKYDAKSYIQKFTPRRTKSLWSKRNTEHIARLTKEGKMKPSGLKAVEAAKADGRWKNAYDSQSTMKLPKELSRELSKYKKAKSFFESLSKSNKYAIAWRLQTAKKPETREKRMSLILAMLKKGKKFH